VRLLRVPLAVMAWAGSALVGRVGYLAGPAVVSEGLADPPTNPGVRVVVVGLQDLDYSRDPERGRAVGDGVDHVAADPWIGIPDQFQQPRPYPAVVGPDVAGAQVPACELAGPAVLALRQLQQPVDSIFACAPVDDGQGGPCLLSDFAPPPHTQTLAPTRYPDHGLSASWRSLQLFPRFAPATARFPRNFDLYHRLYRLSARARALQLLPADVAEATQKRIGLRCGRCIFGHCSCPFE